MEISNSLPIKTILEGKSYSYCIEKVLGQGSFGITYLATVRLTGSLGELQSHISVTIKEFFMHDINGRSGTTVLTGNNSNLYHSYREDFIREANYLSKLHHPHIVKVLEAFEENNTAYFSMEYIEGGNLNDYIQLIGGLPEYDALQGISQIAEAVSFMHNNQMLHLDLKPLNIMRRKSGDLVLIDFGLSKQFNRDGEPESSTSIGAGTMGYAPLEQSSYKKGDGFSPTLDVYALGATLFKMLTGITPPNASTVLNDGFPENAMKGKGISKDIILLTSWAMEPMKSKRPQTVEDFLLELNRILLLQNNKWQDTSEETILLHDESSTQKTYEVCNGFKIKWDSYVSEHRKAQIRELLFAMTKIGEKEQIVNTEYGGETVAILPLMSLKNSTWQYLYPLALGEDSDGFLPSKTIRLALELIVQLEKCTSLPFRLSKREELRFEQTTYKGDSKIFRTLYYSPDNDLQFVPNLKHDYINELCSWENINEICDIQLVCEGLTPAYDGGIFNVPCTQSPFDEICPIGFNLYKVRRLDSWNIASPLLPFYSYLPFDYDSISTIGIWHIPGGGPQSGYDFLGIVTVKENTTTYYSFIKSEFELITSLRPDEIEERKMWT